MYTSYDLFVLDVVFVVVVLVFVYQEWGGVIDTYYQKTKRSTKKYKNFSSLLPKQKKTNPTQKQTE